MAHSVEGSRFCDVQMGECLCGLKQPHKGSHACTCGGRWIGEYDTFRPVSAPVASGYLKVKDLVENTPEEDEVAAAEFSAMFGSFGVL
jgi:hypothetical protein